MGEQHDCLLCKFHITCMHLYSFSIGRKKSCHCTSHNCHWIPVPHIPLTSKAHLNLIAGRVAILPYNFFVSIVQQSWTEKWRNLIDDNLFVRSVMLASITVYTFIFLRNIDSISLRLDTKKDTLNIWITEVICQIFGRWYRHRLSDLMFQAVVRNSSPKSSPWNSGQINVHDGFGGCAWWQSKSPWLVFPAASEIAFALHCSIW